MTFLQPALLIALPLAALPVAIHLIHLYRRRQVKWAATMFLRMAQRMNKGFSRLRQVLILALRVLAIAAILLVITRPLSGGWLGLTGGPPDTVMILVDRSASMEQMNPVTGVSKRLAGLRNITKAINDAVGDRSRLVLIDSAGSKPQSLDKADALLDLPQTEATDTAADIPALLQAALDYMTANKTGRTDVWLLSDFQQTDWNISDGQWEALRRAYATMQGVRFHILGYPEAPADDLAVRIDRIARRETSEKAELLLDFQVTRQNGVAQEAEVSLRFVVNGASTTVKVPMKESRLVMQAHALPIDKTAKHGWGRIELPGDANASNNVFHFAFDEPAVLRSVIVADENGEADAMRAALSAAADPARKYLCEILQVKRAAEIRWEETALIIWTVPLPHAEDPLALQLKAHAAAGHSILFLPPEVSDDTRLFGLGWGRWQSGPAEKPQAVEWWRSDADLLANTRDGTALPVGVVEVIRRCGIAGEGVPLARMADRSPLLMRSSAEGGAGVYFLGTLPGSGSSSLARDGVVMFALLHRALNEGGRTLGKAQQRSAAAGVLGPDPSKWRPADSSRGVVPAESLPLLAGVVASDTHLVALNRPTGEDQPQASSAETLNELFAGLDFHVIKDNLEDGRSLTSEVWRTFLMAMAAALLGEALLCLPQRRLAAAAVAKEREGGLKEIA